VRKTVSFGENDQDLLEFCMNNSERKGIKFATYVKQVLREKLEQGSESIESIIDKRIEEYLKAKNLKLEERAMTEFKKEDKNALANFMKNQK
jgi:hypothetical protein